MQGGGDNPSTDVFLYSKAHLRASGVPLQPETLPPLEVPGASNVQRPAFLQRDMCSSRRSPQPHMLGQKLAAPALWR